jgi:hypothetical protein
MTNAELVALLREARVSVQFHIGLLAWSNNHSPLKTDELAKAEETLARIDAALAAHDGELQDIEAAAKETL